ncbi:hypothetical protein B0T24DRAFT_660923 [Lasiosphaeria ovina]|uniref:DUF7918 domain-containing protein n=1 Tax=Lasiosphaeria ovina TaxID=92902 RepID=A0AAE0NII2_9PEZI|nr:hypothetical protein B0T24DRAFT_660923 [Lasiosphaeria ovina]
MKNIAFASPNLMSLRTRPSKSTPRVATPTLAEKALKGKALDCFASTQDPVPVNHVWEKPENVYNDHLGRPFAVFEFRYWSMALPRKFNPRSNSDGASSNYGETRGEKIYALNVKPERVAGIKREAPEMSEAEFQSRYKSRKLANGRVEVDLTDD